MDDDQMLNLLKAALGPDAPPELERDLWPRMRARLDRPPQPAAWLDWALLAASVAAVVAFPRIMLGVLYHL